MKKIGTILFLAVSAMLLLIPALTTNLKPEQVSSFDNRNLTEFPALRASGFRSGLEGYVSDRIGFRTGMITAYQKFCDIAFHKLIHPNYVYGKGEYIMSPGDLVTYQHLDVDEEYIENFTDYLQSLQQFCQGQGAEFLFYLCPNKDTVYPEYFPDGYNVKDQPNRSERIMEQLEEKGVAYLHPKELFWSLKEEVQLYNVKYDPGHWNETGAFYGHQQIIHYLNEKFPEMGELEPGEFEVTQVLQESLPTSYFEINEMVPSYAVDTDAVMHEEIFEQVATRKNHYYEYYTNEAALRRGAPRVLILGDSYFEKAAKYYLNHSAELMLVHATNLEHVEYFISFFEPDIVVYEVVERQLQCPWDDFKAEKRYATLRGLQGSLPGAGAPWAEPLLLEADMAALRAQAAERGLALLSGSLDETAVENPDDIFMLAAVLNGKEYYAYARYVKDALSYSFTFREEDLAAGSGISFFAFRPAEAG